MPSIDEGTRDDTPVTVEVTVIVPARRWSAGALIGKMLDDKGQPLMIDLTSDIGGKW